MNNTLIFGRGGAVFENEISMECFLDGQLLA
jgi:hypothetical protein